MLILELVLAVVKLAVLFLAGFALYCVAVAGALLLGYGKLHVKRDLMEAVRDPETGEVTLRPVREEFDVEFRHDR